MKEIRAMLNLVLRKKLSGIGRGIKGYDDNVMLLRLQIVDGPAAFVDRRLTLEVGISGFVELLPDVLMSNLYDELRELAGEKKNSEEEN